jgi:hypothetical protein
VTEQETFARVARLLKRRYSDGLIATYLGVSEEAYRSVYLAPRPRLNRPQAPRPPSDWRNRLRPLIRDAAWWYGTHADESAVSLLTQAMEME